MKISLDLVAFNEVFIVYQCIYMWMCVRSCSCMFSVIDLLIQIETNRLQLKLTNNETGARVYTSSHISPTPSQLPFIRLKCFQFSLLSSYWQKINRPVLHSTFFSFVRKSISKSFHYTFQWHGKFMSKCFDSKQPETRNPNQLLKLITYSTPFKKGSSSVTCLDTYHHYPFWFGSSSVLSWNEIPFFFIQQEQNTYSPPLNHFNDSFV